MTAGTSRQPSDSGHHSISRELRMFRRALESWKSLQEILALPPEEAEREVRRGNRLLYSGLFVVRDEHTGKVKQPGPITPPNSRDDFKDWYRRFRANRQAQAKKEESVIRTVGRKICRWYVRQNLPSTEFADLVTFARTLDPSLLDSVSQILDVAELRSASARHRRTRPANQPARQGNDGKRPSTTAESFDPTMSREQLAVVLSVAKGSPIAANTLREHDVLGPPTIDSKGGRGRTKRWDYEAARVGLESRYGTEMPDLKTAWLILSNQR